MRYVIREVLFHPPPTGMILDMRSLLVLSAEAGDPAGADAVILPGVEGASAHLERIRSGGDRPAVFVAVDLPDWARIDRELDRIVGTGPDGVVLRGATTGADILRLSAMLAAREALAGVADGSIAILPVLDTASGLLAVASSPGVSTRLHGLAWDATALAAGVGAKAARDRNGHLVEPCRTARSLCLFAAAAIGIPAFDTAFDPPSDGPAFADETREAIDLGFAGKLAARPDQIAVINEIFAQDN